MSLTTFTNNYKSLVASTGSVATLPIFYHPPLISVDRKLVGEIPNPLAKNMKGHKNIWHKEQDH